MGLAQLHSACPILRDERPLSRILRKAPQKRMRRLEALTPEWNESGESRFAQVESGPEQDGKVDWCQHMREEWIAMTHMSSDRASEVTG